MPRVLNHGRHNSSVDLHSAGRISMGVTMGNDYRKSLAASATVPPLWFAALLLIAGFGRCVGQSSWEAARLSPTAQLFFVRNGPGGDSGGYTAITPEAKAYFLKDRVVFRTADSSFEVQFLGSDSNLKLLAEHALPTVVNYINGSRPQEWATNLPTFGSLLYENIYPGIDVR